MDASQCHRVPGLIAVASQLAYHVLHTASVKRKNTVQMCIQRKLNMQSRLMTKKNWTNLRQKRNQRMKGSEDRKIVRHSVKCWICYLSQKMWTCVFRNHVLSGSNLNCHLVPELACNTLLTFHLFVPCMTLTLKWSIFVANYQQPCSFISYKKMVWFDTKHDMLHVLFKVLLNSRPHLTFYGRKWPISNLYLCSISFNLYIYIPIAISFNLIPNMICLYHELDKS